MVIQDRNIEISSEYHLSCTKSNLTATIKSSGWGKRQNSGSIWENIYRSWWAYLLLWVFCFFSFNSVESGIFLYFLHFLSYRLKIFFYISNSHFQISLHSLQKSSPSSVSSVSSAVIALLIVYIIFLFLLTHSIQLLYHSWHTESPSKYCLCLR